LALRLGLLIQPSLNVLGAEHQLPADYDSELSRRLSAVTLGAEGADGNA
jgi:hypothetical protein